MTPNGPSREEDAPRDPRLEVAFTRMVQQAEAPPAFAARVRARVAHLHPEVRPRSWPSRVVTRLRGAGVPHGGPGADVQEAPRRLRPIRAWAAVLATCLVLSVLGNVWLGVRLLGTVGSGSADKIRLAFADGVGEQDLRALLLSLRASIIGGPSAQGVYVVQVQVPAERNGEGRTDRMRPILEELRKHPYVRLAEPVSPFK